LEHRLESVLTPMERLRIGLDLGSTMLAAGLLLVAFLFQWFDATAQRPLVELFKCVAALIVSAPVFAVALRGIVTGDADDVIEQLVALAVLAALASGEFATAAFVPMILNLGHFLEQRSILGAQAAIDGLKNLYGRTASVLTPQGEIQIEPSALKPDDVVLIRRRQQGDFDGGPVVHHG
jgi:Cd2+/Zn2+-exporting ATPase